MCDIPFFAKPTVYEIDLQSQMNIENHREF